jgi:Cu+-exporting ATPase
VLRKVNALVVDKTGTLTLGKPKLTTVAPVDGWTEEALLGFAVSLERGSEHPLATAIVQGAEERGVRVDDVTDFESATGRGVRGRVGGRPVALGNRRLLDEFGIHPGPLAERAEDLRVSGQTVMFVMVDGVVVGMLGVADPVKETTPEAVKRLHEEGIRIVMLTGDSRTTAEAVARALEIDDVVAEVLPAQKAEVVKRLQAEGRVVAMAGDGINDAPALAQAHVGIAMGTGTDVAMESAGVTLVRGDLVGIVRARRLSRATMRNIRENLFFAFIYNSLGVPVAAGVLYPFFGTLLSPMIAAAAMSFSSVSVIGNALRLRDSSPCVSLERALDDDGLPIHCRTFDHRARGIDALEHDKWLGTTVHRCGTRGRCHRRVPLGAGAGGLNHCTGAARRRRGHPGEREDGRQEPLSVRALERRYAFFPSSFSEARRDRGSDPR